MRWRHALITGALGAVAAVALVLPLPLLAYPGLRLRHLLLLVASVAAVLVLVDWLWERSG